jgi:hypothetical protein
MGKAPAAPAESRESGLPNTLMTTLERLGQVCGGRGDAFIKKVLDSLTPKTLRLTLDSLSRVSSKLYFRILKHRLHHKPKVPIANAFETNDHNDIALTDFLRDKFGRDEYPLTL